MFRTLVRTLTLPSKRQPLFCSKGRLYSTAPLEITDSCVQRLKRLGKKHGTQKMLRLTVDNGGCSGFVYKFQLADATEPDDIVLEKDGEKVLVDPTSLPFVEGAKVTYAEEMVGSSFQIIDNPKSEKSCGCKVSFSPKF